ncbi:hypothetical protein U9M48_041865 [Paspalum notatum var. saurae]|uniref:Uncharacterized protein n=1 Tax=Paspalum notatum var. saurae TaxID=547442 RepID=A0AAQ3UPF4_PASNO
MAREEPVRFCRCADWGIVGLQVTAYELVEFGFDGVSWLLTSGSVVLWENNTAKNDLPPKPGGAWR